MPPTGIQISRLCDLSGGDVNRPFNLLLVDDDPNCIAVMHKMLADFGQVRFAMSAQDALRLARQNVPDLILLDIEMPEGNGFDLCVQLKSDPLLIDVPVIFITSHDSTDQEVTGLSLGAADFISKPPRAPLVMARVRTQLRMKQMADELRQAAHVDGLTGVYNRRKFDEIISIEWLRAIRIGQPLALIMMDIDYFKAFNDQHGHLAGDQCLKTVAITLKAAIRRPTDLLARYGGEEFVLLLPNTGVQGALAVAAQIRLGMEELRLPHGYSPVSEHVTLSMGVSALEDLDPDNEILGDPASLQTLHTNVSASKLIAAADQALYAAKNAGRAQTRYLSMNSIDFPANAAPDNPADPQTTSSEKITAPMSSHCR